MSSLRKRKVAGFTLIELMIVVIIVAVLAAAAVPIYLAQTRRAKLSEAMAGLGAARTAERVYYSEKNAYLAVAAGNAGNDPSDTTPGLGLDFTKNKYFNAGSFAVTVSGATFTITSDGSTSTAPRHSDVSTFIAQMKETGETRYSFDGGTTYTAWE